MYSIARRISASYSVEVPVASGAVARAEFALVAGHAGPLAIGVLVASGTVAREEFVPAADQIGILVERTVGVRRDAARTSVA